MEIWSFKTLLPLVLFSGLLDGINPCAFVVLLFFISFLFTLGFNRKKVLSYGSVYVISIFLAYFLIGVGILKVVHIFGISHLVARIGGWIVIILGIGSLKEAFFPELPPKLRAIHLVRKPIMNWMQKATLPLTFLLGFLIGLSEFPCSGGIYAAVLGLLSSKSTYLAGLGYLFIYNLMFVLPLIVILFLASSKLVTEKMVFFEEVNDKVWRTILGIIMVGIGVGILLLLV